MMTLFQNIAITLFYLRESDVSKKMALIHADAEFYRFTRSIWKKNPKYHKQLSLWLLLGTFDTYVRMHQRQLCTFVRLFKELLPAVSLSSTESIPFGACTDTSHTHPLQRFSPAFLMEIANISLERYASMAYQ